MEKKERGRRPILGKGAHPLGCQAELGLHELQQKLSCRVLPAFSEYPFSCTDLGVHVATLGLLAVVVELCPTLATPWTVAHQPPLFMGFPRREYWSELPFLPPGDLPDPGIEPASPAWAGRFLTTEPPG